VLSIVLQAETGLTSRCADPEREREREMRQRRCEEQEGTLGEKSRRDILLIWIRRASRSSRGDLAAVVVDFETRARLPRETRINFSREATRRTSGAARNVTLFFFFFFPVSFMVIKGMAS